MQTTFQSKFENYFVTLEELSTEALDGSARTLVLAEKQNAAKLIAHIAEMSRRKGALERGYKNLFCYCVERLNLSEGAVAMRIQIANVSRRFPQVLAALAENRISLSVAALLAPHLQEDNVDTLLSDCAGMTKRKAEEYLVALKPKPVFQPSIRKQPTPPQRQAATPPQEDEQEQGSLPPVASSRMDIPRRSSNLVQPARPEEYNFRFTANREFKDKLERLAEVLGVENVRTHMAELLEQALDLALDKKDPKKKLERRQARESKQNASVEKPRPDEISPSVPAKSRYIPSEVRERVLARAGHRCEFVSEDGTRCTSRTGLEIEHTRPFALFRDNDERWLAALCAAHNGFMAEHVYGAAFIRRKIDERLRQNAPAQHVGRGISEDSRSRPTARATSQRG